MLVEFIAVMMVVRIQMLRRHATEAMRKRDPALQAIAEPCVLRALAGPLVQRARGQPDGGD